MNTEGTTATRFEARLRAHIARVRDVQCGHVFLSLEVAEALADLVELWRAATVPPPPEHLLSRALDRLDREASA